MWTKRQASSAKAVVTARQLGKTVRVQAAWAGAFAAGASRTRRSVRHTSSPSARHDRAGRDVPCATTVTANAAAGEWMRTPLKKALNAPGIRMQRNGFHTAGIAALPCSTHRLKRLIWAFTKYGLVYKHSVTEYSPVTGVHSNELQRKHQARACPRTASGERFAGANAPALGTAAAGRAKAAAPGVSHGTAAAGRRPQAVRPIVPPLGGG